MAVVISILGTEYTVSKKAYNADPAFSKGPNLIGYCDSDDKTIVIADLTTFESFNLSSKTAIYNAEMDCLHHEVIHAFLHESGLRESSNVFDGPWSQNEEMVDWFAIQGPKIMEVWKELEGCLVDL